MSAQRADHVDGKNPDVESLDGSSPASSLTATNENTARDTPPPEPSSDVERYEELHRPATAADEKSISSPLQHSHSHVQRPQNVLHESLFVAILVSAQFMTQAALAQAIAPLDIIGNTFRTTNPGELSWFAAAYSLTVGTFILPAGRLGDLYGHKRLFVAGYLWLALWELLGGFSVYSDQKFFDVCRAMQGIGPSLMLPNAIAILGRAYEPGRRKEFIFSLLGATAPAGFVFGAVFASLLSQFAWWPWAYWIMAIVTFFLGIAAIWIVPPTPTAPQDTSVSLWKRIDAAGIVTGVTGLVLFNVAWNQGPTVGWTTPYVYILLILGIATFLLFAYIESRALSPLVPLKQLHSPAAFVLACIATGWGSFGIWIFYFWRFYTQLRLQSPLLSSAMFIPTMFGGLAAALTTAYLLSRIAPSWLMVISLTAFCVGSILLATAPVDQIYWAQTFVAALVTPWGMDMSFPAATILLSNALPRKHQGAAASLVNTVVNYSISIALGMAGTIEVHVNGGGTTPEELLKGYRSALYFGIGLSGLGILVAAAFVLSESVKSGRVDDSETEHETVEEKEDGV